MRDSKVIGAATALVLLGSVLATGYCLTGGLGPHIDAEPFGETGRVLARQTLALLKPGGQVTVISRDTATFQNPATDIQLTAFRKELAGTGARIDTVELLQIDPLRPAAVPSGDFFQWIKKAAKGSVLVSLMGPPVLTQEQVAQLGEVKPAIVAFCPGPVRDQVDLRALFTQKILHAAVVSKRTRTPAPSRTESPREEFDREFVAVTPENVAVLSTLSSASP